MAAYEPRARATRKTTPWWAGLAGVLAVAGAVAIGLYLARSDTRPDTTRPALTGSTPSAPTPAAPAPQHPIAQALGGAVPADDTALPPLDASDAAMAAALGAMFGGGMSSLLNPEHVVQRIVATVDSLPRKKLSPDALPVRGAPGTLVTRPASGTGRELDTRNSERYAAYANIARAIDAKKLVAWYVHSYPLFQQAYRELGYPDGYFNDRLVVAIDDLLATPELTAPVALVPAENGYAFADPALESRSAGQKLLLRSGPDNEATIKAKLREIRAALTDEPPPASAAAAGAPTEDRR